MLCKSNNAKIKIKPNENKNGMGELLVPLDGPSDQVLPP